MEAKQPGFEAAVDAFRKLAPEVPSERVWKWWGQMRRSRSRSRARGRRRPEPSPPACGPLKQPPQAALLAWRTMLVPGPI